MELKEILKKSQNKVNSKQRVTRKQVTVAMDERPYQEKSKNKSKNNQAQTKLKPDINQAQINHKYNTNQMQTGLKQDTGVVQSGNGKNIAIETLLFLLVGNEKKLLDFFYSICKKNSDGETTFLTKTDIAQGSQIKLGSLKTCISRLIKKGFIQRIVAKKGGANAVSQFKIPSEILLQLNRTQT